MGGANDQETIKMEMEVERGFTVEDYSHTSQKAESGWTDFPA